MSKNAGMPEADSCWDDGFDDDEDCEKYLQSRKTKITDEDAEENKEDDSDAAGDEEEADAEYETVAEGETEDEETSDEEDADDVEDADGSEETAEEDAKSLEASSTGSKKMAKAKTGGKVTKADAIRAIIEAKQAAGVDIRPRDIIDALNKKGIEVNASQVSITLRAMGVPPTKRGGGGRPPKAKTDEVAPKTRATAKIRAVEPQHDGHGPGYHDEDIEKASELLRSVGSYESAVSLLGLCHRVMNRA